MLIDVSPPQHDPGPPAGLRPTGQGCGRALRAINPDRAMPLAGSTGKGQFSLLVTFVQECGS
jgi:hypothetical protein